MSDQGRLQAKLDRSQLRRYREVFPAVHVAPLGKRRSKVQIGGCQADVEAQRSDEFKKGQRVTVVQSSAGGGATILDGPPGVEGPIIQGEPVRVKGQAFLPPVPQEVVGLHFTLDDDPPTIFAFEYDQATGAPLALIMSTPALAGSDDTSGMRATGIGAGNFVVTHARPFLGFGRDYIMLINARTGLRSTYLWPVPPAPNGSRYKISNVAIKDGDVYWVELEFDNGLNEHTWELMRAPGGLVAAAAIEETFTLSNTTLDPGTVEDIHIRSDNLLFFDSSTSTWLYDTLVRWWEGGQMSSNLGLTIEFGAVNQEIALVSRGHPRHVVDTGNVGVGASLAVEYNASGAPSLIWPASGDTETPLARLVSGIGLDKALDNSYVVMTRPGFTPDGLFDWREGDLANPTPTITLVDCADASGLVGGKALEPMAGMRA